jgi:hypothetical protein
MIEPELEEPILELTGTETGVYNVYTQTSLHVFDFDNHTVERFSGPNASQIMGDERRTIFEIHACKVGKPGYWTMGDGPVWEYWHRSTEIVEIRQV